MHPIEYPVAFGHWHVQSDTLTCRLPRRQVKVHAPRELLHAVSVLCTGRLRWTAVADHLARQWESGNVDAFLRNLAREGALVEASESLANWAEALAEAPSGYPRLASLEEIGQLPRAAQDRLIPGRGALACELPLRAGEFTGLLKARTSYRTFADAPLPGESLGAILWAAHGVARPATGLSDGLHRTVASGGNMHSARWFVFVLRQLDAGAAFMIPPGLYEARFHLDGGTSLDPLGSREQDAWNILGDPRALTFASALVLPVYDVALPARKYGNRAMLFASVEAGQALQNAQLMAVSLGAAACVRGDIAAAEVRKVVAAVDATPTRGRAHCMPMPGLLLGARPDEHEVAAQHRDRWLELGAFAMRPTESGARARPQQREGFAFQAGPVQEGPRQIFTCGRAADPRLAVVKAEAEAWERHGWAHLGHTIESAAKDIPSAIDPALLVHYTARQHASTGFPFAPFSSRRRYLWREGVDVLTGAPVFLPAEHVHALSALPAKFQASACTNSSTSGTAAWTDAEGALCRATLELLERDAFLRQWLSRRPPNLVDTSSLPARLRNRVTELEDAGHRVAIAQIGNQLVPVFSVFIQHVGRPFTAITAAADFSPEAALDKALDEAEGRAAHASSSPAKAVKSARDVQSPADINRFYQTRRYYRCSDFYAAGPRSDPFGSRAGRFCADWSALKSKLHELRLQLLAVDLTPPGASIHQGRTPLHVVRAFVPGLLPIWFQYGLQPAAALAAAPRGRLSDAAFIHPFT